MSTQGKQQAGILDREHELVYILLILDDHDRRKTLQDGWTPHVAQLEPGHGNRFVPGGNTTTVLDLVPVPAPLDIDNRNGSPCRNISDCHYTRRS